MPYTPQFGGTNEVVELDVGQLGSPRRASGELFYYPRVSEGRPETRDVMSPLPQQPITFVEQMGFSGQVITWRGTCKIKDAAALGVLRSLLSEYRTGQGIAGLTGLRGPVDPAKRAATKLTDFYGNALADSAIMVDYAFGVMDKPDTAGFDIITELTLTFRVLR